MAQTTCSIEGCESQVEARGWCEKHYARNRRHGDPLGGGTPHLSWPENLLQRMEPQANGCVHYTGSILGSGYGQISVNDEMRLAHRAAYELFVGPIPDGLTLDHECHNREATCAGGPTCLHRRCVNVDHLVPKPMGENTNASPNSNAAKTHCKHGHEFTPENTIQSKDGRRCRACKASTRQPK